MSVAVRKACTHVDERNICIECAVRTHEEDRARIAALSELCEYRYQFLQTAVTGKFGEPESILTVPNGYSGGISIATPVRAAYAWKFGERRYHEAGYAFGVTGVLYIPVLGERLYWEALQQGSVRELERAVSSLRQLLD
jgi:hypothetical protein